jgi:hypothetical protein
MYIVLKAICQKINVIIMYLKKFSIITIIALVVIIVMVQGG